MRLDSVVIQGFRKYADPFEISFDASLTALVGRNDAGKSTVLEALDIFFGNAKLDAGDFSVGAEPGVSFTATFSDLPSALVLDSSRATDLAGEYLLDDAGCLQLRKSWTRPGAAAVVHAMALHPRVDGDEDFLVNAKITRLRSLASGLEVGDRRVAADLRKAVLKAQVEAGAELCNVAVPLTSEDGKAVASALERYLPQFHLFRADRTGSEADSLAQDPAKTAIKMVLARHEEQLANLSSEVTEQIRSLLMSVVEKLHEVDSALADRLSLTDIFPDWSKAFSSLRFEDDRGVALAKRGNGTRRLVLLSFFRATVDADEDEGRAIITAIEEPETALHPDLQRDLMRSLQDLGAGSGRQSLITTHSSNLVRDIPATSLRYITQAPDGGAVCVVAPPGGDASALLRELNGSLGVLTDHSVRCFVMVEGRNDIDGLRALSRGLSLIDESEVVDFEKLEREGLLCLLPIGGCGSLPLWEGTLDPLSRRQFCVVDSDRARAGSPLKSDVQAVVDRACDGREVLALDRRELENYLTPEAVCTTFSDLAGFAAAFEAEVAGLVWSYIDIPEICARTVHALHGEGGDWDELAVDQRRRKESRAKKRLAQAFDDISVAEALLQESSDLLGLLRNVSRVALPQSAGI